jgi:hypothetical protein
MPTFRSWISGSLALRQRLVGFKARLGLRGLLARLGLKAWLVLRVRKGHKVPQAQRAPMEPPMRLPIPLLSMHLAL